jgi:cyclic pyranopterin phosphate synthase
MPLRDLYGRSINYLRLSVTDRCNLRCSYCLPACGVRKVKHDDILSYEELCRVARAAVNLGVEKIRITGGEPLVRKGITGFLAELKRIPGLKRLVLTTNGILLEEMAEELKAAGVESLNISLDSLRPDRFTSITRGGKLNRVLRGIAAAERTGFRFLKINVVVMRGVNDDEVADFAALTLDKPLKVRFIEYMPTLKVEGGEFLTVAGEELLVKLSQSYSMQRVAKQPLDGPAVYYRIKGAAGEIGFISPISCHFCSECNRIRVTSTGIVKGCLFDNGVLDMKPILARGNAAELEEALRRVVEMKPGRHTLMTGNSDHAAFAMAQIGG